MKRKLFLTICLTLLLVTGCGKEANPAENTSTTVSQSESTAIETPEQNEETEPLTTSEAFIKCVEDAGLRVSLSDKYADYISITALSSDYSAMTWGISEESGELTYGGSQESIGFGEPGEYKITGYMAIITSFAGTALYDGIVDDNEVISMYHELGEDGIEDKDITEFSYVAEFNDGEIYHKVVNIEDGIWTEDLSVGAHNLTYSIVKDNMIFTIYGSYDNKEDIEALVASIRAINADPDNIERTGFATEE